MVKSAQLQTDEGNALAEYADVVPPDPREAASFAAALARLRGRQAEMEAAGGDPLLALAGAWQGTPDELERLLREIEEMRHIE